MVKRFISSGLLLCAAAMPIFAQSDTIETQQLNEVVVKGQGALRRLESKQLGAEKLELSNITKLPHLFGECDIVKSISLMPGVHSEGDGGGGFEVRGGNASQNLIMLDGMTLYNPSHVLGVFSTFNSDAINRATLYKGPIPAMYGEAISSALDVGLSAGDNEEYHGSATIGLLAAKLKVEGPIVKDKLSFAVSARRSYLDMFLKLSDEYKSTVLNFYDVTAKIRYDVNARNSIEAAFIATHDNMAVKELMGMHWGNVAGALNWYYRPSGNLRLTTTASFTDYTPTMWMSVINVDQTMHEYIHNANFNSRLDYAVNDNSNLQFGLRSEYLQVKSGEFLINNIAEREVRNGWQKACWVKYDTRFNGHWSTESGVRFSFFNAMKHHEFVSVDDVSPLFADKLYFDTEFRLNLKYEISSRHNLKFGIGDVTQNLHAVRSSSTSFPFDRYALTSATVKPERSFQFGLGYAGMTEDGTYDWSAELYHRDSKNVYDYKDGLNMFSSIDLESIILGGNGRSYGLELMFRKNTGKLTGWVSYTLSKTQTKIDGINNGRWYDATNDRRHDFNVTANYQINKRWNLSASWVYTSGTPLTAPDVKYQLDGTTCYYYARRNAYRTPASHHLDVSANYVKQTDKFTHELSFGFYNLYNHYNPYAIYFEDDASKPSGTRAVQQSLYGVIPSISYTFKF